MRGEAIVQFGVEMAMRDGTVLRADITRPKTDRPVPVILMRNPYMAAVARQQFDPLRVVEAGFAFVAQMARGRGDSDGSFEPWVAEQQDGVDSIAWCAEQQWSNGRVGMMGGSYLGHVQTYAAAGRPPALKAIAPSIVPSSPYDLTYNGGAVMLGGALGWSAAMTMMILLRRMQAGEDVMAGFGALMGAGTPDDLCRITPLREIPGVREHFPAWGDWLDHPSYDDWWHARDVGERDEIPAFFLAGWWDLFVTGSIEEFHRSRHPKSKLVIGPWSHILQGSAHGEVLYGQSGGASMNDMVGQQLDFLGRYLFEDRPEPEGAPVRIFVMGANVWRDEQEWPLARAIDTKWYLQSDGSLTTETPPADAAPCHYTFDPLDPVPTLGGRNLMVGGDGGHRTGPCNHQPNDVRADILRFTSDVLTEDLEVTGPVSLHLSAATSAVDTDWTAMLLDVWPDGRSYNVVDGIIRARARSGTDRPIFLPPGEVHDFTIDMAVTSQVFKAGHRLRVAISSSNFPRYDRNPGTGELSADAHESTFVKAEQTVCVDASRPSWISLPEVREP